jgi:trehalose/maltose transport system substrate-binding protein
VLSEGMSCYRGVKLSLFDRAPGKKHLALPALQRLFLGKYAICALLILVAVRLCQSSSAFQPVRGITLTVAGFGYQAAEKLSSEGLSEFIRNTGIQVQFLPSWGNSADQLSLILKTLGRHFSTPDVYLIDVIWPGTLHQHLLDLGPYLLAAGLANDPGRYLPELLKNDTVAGRIVSLPFYVNAGMLFFRTDLLRKYGYRRPPSSWDEMQKMAARIQRGERAAGHNSFWGYIWQGGAYEGLTCNALEWQASFGGGRIIEPDGAIRVNNRQAASAFRMAAGWVGSISPPSVVSYTESDSLNVFRSGNAAFMRYWSSGYRANQAAGSQVRGRFNVTQLPAGPGGRAQTVGGFQLAVSRYSAHSKEAAELVEYLTSNKVQKLRVVQEGYLPAISQLYSDTDVLEAVPEAKVLRSARRESWVARPSSIAGAKYSTISRDYYETVHRILTGQESPEQALDELEKRLVALKINARSGDR